MTSRVYLDWNASAPLRPEARAAMLAAMDVFGNPSSVHAEGRAAKAIVEKARGQVAALVGCEPDELVFTSGATEAARSVFRFDDLQVFFALKAVEHDCVSENILIGDVASSTIAPEGDVRISWGSVVSQVNSAPRRQSIISIPLANGEVGSSQFRAVAELVKTARRMPGGNDILTFSDAAQAAGKITFAVNDLALEYAIFSAHKLGGPKGTGALFASRGADPNPLLVGGGQEQGRRSGTENVIGIAGFGAAAEAAQRDLEAGIWDRVAKLRDDLEDRLAATAPDLIVFGKDAPRLPNTSCFAIPGWRGETQVMQMDLAGYAVSAGSACSSGKVNKASRVLLAMGFDEVTASSAIRVSMGPTTTEAEVMGFADTWIEHYRRRKVRAA